MDAESEDSDLVSRDKNGDYEIGEPLIPDLEEEDDGDGVISAAGELSLAVFSLGPNILTICS
jgi:hypothetical protein